MSPSARMTAASGIARQLATWQFCARSPLTSWAGTEHPGSACGRIASRPPGMTSTCSLFWLDVFMRRTWRHALDLAELGGLGRLVEADAVVQALILVAGRLAEHTAMPARAVLQPRRRSRPAVDCRAG